MSLKDLLSLAPVPGLDIAITLLTSTYSNIRQISVYRKQCEDMAGRCVSLMVSVNEGSEGLEGTRAVALADQLRPVLEKINRKMQEWADWGPLKCFLQQGELKDGLDILRKELDAAIFRFGVSMNLELQRGFFENRAIQEATRAEFRSSLQAILESQLEVSKLLAISSPRPVEQIMMHLQTELQDPNMPAEQNESFKKGLWDLHSKTSKLPPLTDLTGQVELDDRNPQFIGSYNDVYLGTWLDNEKVAVRLPKTLSDSADVQKRFQQEVSLWRTLNHPNVLPLYGIVYLGRHLYSVAPWMVNGTAIAFVQKWPQYNLLKILSEAAEGLAYLHSKDIVHGDLRGANVLISEDGVARLSDFGLSKFLADCNKGLTTSSTMNPRWLAPEILHDQPMSKKSDIWAFGMTCLELLSGQQPFSHIIQDYKVQNEISKWKTPNRPTDPSTVSAGLNDDMWAVLKRCWKKPEGRPTIEEVQVTLAEIRGEISPGAINQPKRRFTVFGKSPRQKSSLDIRPNTAGSEASSNSSGSVRITPLKSFSISSSIQEHYEQPELSPLTPLSTSPNSVYSGRPPYSPILPNRRPSLQASESQFSDNYFNPSSSFVPSSYSYDSPRIEITRAPKLELAYLETPPSSFNDRSGALRSPPKSYTSGTLNTTAKSILTVDSTKQEPSLQNAISDRDRIVYTNASGSVVAGTLEGLVDRLVDNFNLRKDEDYREVILTACIDFITPEDLFAMLQWRFDEAEQDTQRHYGDRVATQYNVFKVINYWLTRRQLPVDSQLLWQMRGFCETAIRMKTSSTMVNAAADLLQLIEDRPRQDAARTPLSPGRRMLTADEISPQGLAIALTLLEGDKFKQIMPCDYLANQCGRPGYNNVDAASSVNNKIILWVKQSLLHYDALQSRAAVLKFFINTAQECRKLRNYQSLIAIAIALDSAPVQSLELTRNYLSSKMVAQLEELVRLPDPEGNHYRYREALKQVIDPAYANHCIPWIAVHLKELHSVLHLNKRVVEIKGRPLLNFQRYAKFMDRVKQIFPCPPPDLERYRQQGQLTYLEDKLANIRAGEEADVQLIARAEYLAKVEQALDDVHALGWKKMGFKVPKPLQAGITG